MDNPFHWYNHSRTRHAPQPSVRHGLPRANRPLGGLALAGEAIFGEVPAPPPAPLRLTGAALRGTNPSDGGFTVLEGQVTATGGTGAVAMRLTDNFVDGCGTNTRPTTG